MNQSNTPNKNQICYCKNITAGKCSVCTNPQVDKGRQGEEKCCRYCNYINKPERNSCETCGADTLDWFIPQEVKEWDKPDLQEELRKVVSDIWQMIGIMKPMNREEFIGVVLPNLHTDVFYIIEQALRERDAEIVEWLRNRCKGNIEVNGTDKWNEDMEELIEFINSRRG